MDIYARTCRGFSVARWLLCLAFSLMPASAKPVPSYTIIDLDPVGKEGKSSKAVAINDAGQVTGGAFFRDEKDWHAFLYDGKTTRDLGVLDGDAWSEGLGINSEGWVVGKTGAIGVFGAGFVYDGKKMEKLPVPIIEALDINKAGLMVVSARPEKDRGLRAGVYDGKKVTLLGEDVIEAFAINGPGQITRSIWFQPNPKEPLILPHAMIYLNGKVTDLGGKAGRFSSGVAINSPGDVAGSADFGNGPEAFLYSDGKMKNLGVPKNGLFSFALGINDLAMVVGRYDTGEDIKLPLHAFVYDQGFGILDLNDLIPKDSGWLLTDARDINNRGQIVGSGIVNGKTHAFLLTPVANQAAPDSGPNALLVGVLCGGMLLWNQCRQSFRATPDGTYCADRGIGDTD